MNDQALVWMYAGLAILVIAGVTIYLATQL
jgi:hypothetical protein